MAAGQRVHSSLWRERLKWVGVFIGTHRLAVFLVVY